MEQLITIFNNSLNNSNFTILVYLISFLGGIVASISPCSLGILPLIVAYVTGNQHNKTVTFIHMVLFVLGLSITLTIIGIICALTGHIFASIAPTYFVLFLASLILIFGLSLSGILEINYPTIIKQLPSNSSKWGLLFPLILGMVFALAASPCSTPILAAIMATASLSKNILQASIMLLLFALGQGVIVVLAGMFTSFITNLKGSAKYSEILVKISGIILIFFAFYLYYRCFSGFWINY